MTMNDALFERIKYVYDRRDSLAPENRQPPSCRRILQNFTRNGALLDAEKKEELKKSTPN